MRLACAFVGVALLAQQVEARQVEPKRVEEATATLQVRVVGPDRKAAPSGVEVRVVAANDLGGSEPFDREKLKQVERSRLAAALARSRAFPLEADGHVDLPRPAGPLVVVASTTGHSGSSYYVEQSVAADDAGPIELKLHADRSLAVRVSDSRGHTLAHVPVAIAGFATNGPIPDVLFETTTTFHAVVATREIDGVAYFDHVQEWIDPDGDEDSIAFLAVPHRDHEQVRITPTLLEEGLVELHAPLFGSVELHLPGVEHAAVRLRERPEPPPPDGEFEHHVGFDEWRQNEPLELPVVDGVARSDRIGVGCTLEVEACWSGLSTPLHAEFAGPECAGAAVSWTLGADGGDTRPITASLQGRLLDASRRPLASRVLRGRIVESRQEIERGVEAISVVTDGSGRFELKLGPRAPAADVKRWLEVGEFAASGARGWLDVSDRLGAGSADLGDLLLVGADSASRLEALGDDALIVESTTIRAWPGDVASKAASFDLRLNEMARRGGPRCVTFFELEIVRQRDEATAEHEERVAEHEAARARVKERRPATDENGEDADAESEADEEAMIAAELAADAEWTSSLDLKWAALLRRAQRRPAPIVLEPLEAKTEAGTPESPRVMVRVHDVDAGFDRLYVPRLDESPWRATVFDHEGHVVPEPPFEPMFICIATPWGSSSGTGFDQSYVEVAPLGRQFENARPGEYRVRVEYMVGDVAVITSRDLAVRIRPVPIRVPRRDYDAMVAEIRAIDVSKPVPLTHAAIDSRDAFTGDPETPEDRIARSGRDALPALLDELVETTDDPRRRAWILGLLWDMQVANSITNAQIEAAVGTFEWSHRWPTVAPSGDDHGPGTLYPGRHGTEPAPAAAPDVAVQRELAATWTELRAWFEFTIGD